MMIRSILKNRNTLLSPIVPKSDIYSILLIQKCLFSFSSWESAAEDYAAMNHSTFLLVSMVSVDLLYILDPTDQTV